jgi:DNA-binding transcriptional MerR regulator
MNNITKILTILEAKEDPGISPTLLARAKKAGMSIEEIRKYSKKSATLERLLDRKQESKWKEEDKVSSKKEKETAKTAKKDLLSDKEFNKICKDAASDWKDDNDDKDVTLGHVAPDLADSMLYDPKILAYVKHKLGSEYSKQNAKEFVADSIHG